MGAARPSAHLLACAGGLSLSSEDEDIYLFPALKTIKAKHNEQGCALVLVGAHKVIFDADF